jgi:hypothetical protein
MRRITLLLFVCLPVATWACAADLATAPSQELLNVYKQLRTIQATGEVALAENAVFKRDAATFTFVRGRMTFAAPIGGRVIAAQFQGEGIFDLDPPSAINKSQIGRWTGKLKLTDTFHEAVFFFTDDSYSGLSKLMKLEAPAGRPDKDLIVAAQTQYSENYTDWRDNQIKGNPTMRNLAARILADLTDNSSKGFFLAGFKTKGSGDLLFHISWNRDSLLLPDYAKGEEVLLLHLNPGNYFEWWSGFHLSSEYAKTLNPDHRNLLAHCATEQIDLQIAKDNSLSATAQMESTISDGSVRVLPFSLNGVLRISSIEDGAGNKLSYIQEDRKLDNDPWLILPTPAKPGEKYAFKITYKEDSTRDTRIVFQRGSGLYYVTSRESWYPSFGAFDDRTQFELRARSPKRFKFVASGALVSSAKDKDDLVTSWKSEIPLGVFGFNYGDFAESTQTAPNLTVTAYSGKEVPDELKALQAQISIAELSGNNRAEAEAGLMRGGFNTASNVKYAAAVSMQALRLFDFLFGVLPFKTVSVTEQPIRGYGQSWPNLIFLPYDSLLDATTRNSLGLSRSGEAREFYNIVAIHEMAHQWWGHLVGWKTYHDQWLSEGIAEFASSYYLRQFEPKQVDSYWSLKRDWLLRKNPSGYRPVDAGPLWLNAQLDDRNENSSGLIYYKGAYVMEMLRTLMYDRESKNPDTRFIAMMHDFVTAYAAKNASTDDFRQIVEKHTGSSMEWFFNEWIYGMGVPRYDFSYQLTDAGGGQTNLAMTITQSNVPESFRMQLPMYAVINGENRYMGLIGVTGNKPATSSIKLPVRPEKIMIDPNHSILAEIHQ